MSTIQLGISACLLGQRVRYDGQHKLDLFLRDTLVPWIRGLFNESQSNFAAGRGAKAKSYLRYFEPEQRRHAVKGPASHEGNHGSRGLGRMVRLIPVCPEVECGMPVPRDPMRLSGSPAAPRLITISAGLDLTDQMQRWMAGRLRELAAEELSGFIFKSRSPSCDLAGLEVQHPDGSPAGHSPGLFAAAFMRHFPALPVEDESRLQDPAVRDSFIERIFMTVERGARGRAPIHWPSSGQRLSSEPGREGGHGQED